ncbi:hypothetical protein SAMN02910292_02530 [Lachnospiraceae bacterium XBB2008]|nr:hypothetical protein SAMN02910292_02530 [Lachnospiraceae bacterium XBB2008]
MGGISLRPPMSEDEAAFINEYIPSREIREWLLIGNIPVQDRNKATLVWVSDKTFADKHKALTKIANNTNMPYLAAMIHERIEYDERAIERLKDSGGGFVYMLRMEDDQAHSGFYASYDLAYKVGIRSKASYKILKHQVLDKVEGFIPCRKITGQDKTDEDCMLYKEWHSAWDCISRASFDSEGQIIDYESSELTREEAAKVDPIRRGRFEGSMVMLPNPFDKGDRVRDIRTPEPRYGKVLNEHDKWAKQTIAISYGINLAPGKYSDNFVEVEYEDTGRVIPVSLIYLEKADRDTYSLWTPLNG